MRSKPHDQTLSALSAETVTDGSDAQHTSKR
jgi:hypothetical protein